MNHYELKLERRRERLQRRAERARQESAAQLRRSDDAVAGIPPGQPILVGHHSERRHRRDLERSHNAMRRGLDAQNKARELERRAESVGRSGISSDDPEAVEKIRERIERLEAKQEFMRDANRVIRSKPKNEPTPEKLERLRKLWGSGNSATDNMLRRLFAPDDLGRVGFPDYALKNNNANIRRLKERIAEIERSRAEPAREYGGNGWRVVEDPEENRILIIFDEKPAPSVRAELRRAGWRWSPSRGAWSRHLNSAGRASAAYISERL